MRADHHSCVVAPPHRDRGVKILVTGGSGFIGTNLIDGLLRDRRAVLNVDIRPPKLDEHRDVWQHVDILDADLLTRTTRDFAPTHVIHLAARTDTDGTDLADYEANTTGTIRVLDAVKATPSVERVIVTSSQFVNQYRGTPEDDFDFAPHTVYGESKVLTEKATRAAGLTCTWTIIRPTNIWGPWHPRYPDEFWRVLARGLYVHPGRQRIVRSYGYVKNVTYQIMRIANFDAEKVAGKVIYVGDEPVELIDWANGFSVAQTGKTVRVVPRSLVRTLAIAGDLLGSAGIKFPITSSRYQSMTTGNAVSMAPTLALLGPAPFTLEAGIRDTVDWMRQYKPHLVTNPSRR